MAVQMALYKVLGQLQNQTTKFDLARGLLQLHPALLPQLQA